MPSEQIDPILAAKFFFRRPHSKRHAAFVQADFFRAPVVFFAETDANNFRFCSRNNFFRPFVVAVHKKFSVRRQQFREPAFFLRDARDIAKKFQMLATDVRQHAEFRLDHFHERRQFARMIRAGFQHGGLMRFFQPQQCQRHADVIVETRLARTASKISGAKPTRAILSPSFCRSSRQRKSPANRIAADKPPPIFRAQFLHRPQATSQRPARLWTLDFGLWTFQ